MASSVLRRWGRIAACAGLLAAATPAALAQSPAAPATPAAAPVNAEDAAVFGPNEPARQYKAGKVIHARRIMGDPPQVDGRVTDEAWQGADAATGFTQRDPDNGKPMTEETRIQVVYDSRYLYIAVTCVDTTPAGVTRGFSRRDEEPPTDMVNIGLDPRHDHLTGYIFQTNPSSWQGDMSLFDDDRADRDYNSNWEVQSQVTETGWTAEFRIPFSQMRFTAAPTAGQVWGFDAKREIRRKGEEGFWVPRPRGERGDVSRFGHLVFDQPLTPPGRLEVLPYVLTRANHDPSLPAAYGLSGGGDVRYGLGTGSTLSATLNPDFGQVEQDPAVLNLSIYESFFPEKRPFFLEDSRTFVPPYGLFQVFHSRRIGRTPGRLPLATGDTLLSQPGDTTIVGAGKLTGKSAGWTYGLLTAETSREYAKVVTTDGSGTLATRTERLIEPASSYNVVRVQRDLRGSSNVGAILTGVMREKADDAWVGGFDYNLRWNRTRDGLNGHWVVTHAPGDGGVKNGVGGVANVNFNRKHADGGVHFDHFDQDFRITDLGFLRTRTNRNRLDGNIEIGQPDPGERLRFYWFGLNGGQSWNSDRLVFERNVESYFAFGLKNFWRGHFGGGRNFAITDDLETRGGPPIFRPGGNYAFFHLESDSRKTWQWTTNIVGGGGDHGTGAFLNFGNGIRLQPSDRLQGSVELGYQHGNDVAQWINNLDVDGDGVTDYVYGTLHRDVVDLVLRETYAFTRDLTLQAYVQPFVAVGDYVNTRRLARANSFDFQPVALSYDPDFNSKSLRSNVVLRWEYVKGSTLYVVWNMSQTDDSRPGVFSAWHDLGTAFGGGNASHVFMVKASYWLNH